MCVCVFHGCLDTNTWLCWPFDKTIFLLHTCCVLSTSKWRWWTCWRLKLHKRTNYLSSNILLLFFMFPVALSKSHLSRYDVCMSGYISHCRDSLSTLGFPQFTRRIHTIIGSESETSCRLQVTVPVPILGSLLTLISSLTAWWHSEQ